ncbi:MAG: lamin tail domain-containing protein [Chryseolinea sp.]
MKTLTTKIIVAFFILLLTQQSFGQFTDNFVDGDFTANPVWVGNESKFVISSNQLKLQAPAIADMAYLSTASSAINDASWEFLVTIGFNPSSSNYIRVYLVSDSSNVSGSLNGYYVMLGNTADEISLYRQSGTTRTKIIDGIDGHLNLSASSTKVKVTRDASGNWELFSDVGATRTYTSEGTAIDATHLSSTYFGLYYKYTATRSTLFYFDDIVVTGNPIVDSTLPIITSLQVISSTEIGLAFSEKLEKVSAEAIENYMALNGLGNPAIASLQSDGKTVRLSFAQDFQNGVECSLTTSHVKDLAGNEMVSVSRPFLYFEDFPVSYKDLIITEIFADPSPQIKLPNAEYIEIFNRSEHAIDLTNWILTDGSSSAAFSSKILLPNAYLILTSTVSVGDFSSFGNVLGLSNFPTLNNDGDPLVIRSSTGLMLDSVNYSDDWYLDDDKKAGGWSLERVSFTAATQESQNWKSASSIVGYATPGYVNSNSRKQTLQDESVKVDPPAFIPINGQPNFTQIQFQFDQGGYVANIKIFDSQGHQIKQLANNEILGTEGFFRWDGDRDDGNKARAGYYMVLFEVFNSAGTVNVFRKPVVIAVK